MPRDSAVSDLNALLDASGEIRRPFESQVYLNLAFYVGDQWVAWDGSQIYQPELDDYREKVVDNRIKPAVRTEIARMSKTRPTWIATPKSTAEEDVSAARYAEMVMDERWRALDMRRKLRSALMWSRVCLHGYWKVYWDPTIGAKSEYLVNAETNKVARDGSGAPIPGHAIEQLPEEVRGMYAPKTIAKGDVCLESRNFFQVYPDPHATEDGLSTAEWVGEKAVYTRDYIERHFPDHADRLTYDSKPHSGIGRGQRALTRFSAANEAVQEQVRGIELCEYWSLDKHVVWSKKDDLVLVEEANPYPWLPYVMFRGDVVPGQFYGDCMVTQLIPRQVSLNKALSQIEENAGRIGNPPFLRPSTMGDDDWTWQGLPGEEVVYNDTGSPNAMPSFMQVPELPGYVQNIPAQCQASIMEISGQHEVTGASVPAGVTAASAINLLQEQDDTRLGPDVDDMSAALEEAGKRVLWIVGEKWTDERHLKVSGEDGQWDVLAFKGNYLKGQTDDIECQIGSGLPQSKAAKQAAISQTLNLLVQNGVPMAERDLRRILAQYEVGGLEQFFATQQRDTRQVQEENRLLTLPGAQPFPINSFDNDDVHISEHEDFQKTSRYRMLDPANQQAFEMHVMQHRQRKDEMEAAALQQQMMAGMPSPPGGAPPPGGVASPQTAPTNGGSPNGIPA